MAAHLRAASRRWYSSVSAEEVSHFAALAGEWWDPHGTSRLLHLMNPLRHDFIRSCVGPRLPSTYLDIGCGGGIFAESAARLPSTKHVTGIDPTRSVLEVARAHARRDPMLRGRLEYVEASVEQLGPGREYDVVTLFEVIEHVQDRPEVFLERVRPLVRPGGWLVGSTIARTWASWLVTNVLAEDVLRVVPRGTHDWKKYVDSEELTRCFADGWDGGSARIMGVVYVPGLGWREVKGGERVGNYFFAIRRE